MVFATEGHISPDAQDKPPQGAQGRDAKEGRKREGEEGSKSEREGKEGSSTPGCRDSVGSRAHQ